MRAAYGFLPILSNKPEQVAGGSAGPDRCRRGRGAEGVIAREFNLMLDLPGVLTENSRTRSRALCVFRHLGRRVSCKSPALRSLDA
ncbi:hypothetical protein D6850_05655 [Roseovarius spongiae]|uniref:Uncharacterized protein n=1 Tax=Roseovarius spongiae TaxID=2320272 RepID=A0A3A8AYF9_9RHOB|nr:hypothetical protein D6850_05655 [Roseovarius spongiae]